MNWSSVLGLRNGREGPSQIPLSRLKSVAEAQILGWVTQWKIESCLMTTPHLQQNCCSLEHNVMYILDVTRRAGGGIID